MNTVFSKAVGTIGLLGISAVALAGPAQAGGRRKSRSDFVTGGVIGAFAAGPVGAVVGAGLGYLARQPRAPRGRREEGRSAGGGAAGRQVRTAGREIGTAERQEALTETNRTLTAQAR